MLIDEIPDKLITHVTDKIPFKIVHIITNETPQPFMLFTTVYFLKLRFQFPLFAERVLIVKLNILQNTSGGKMIYKGWRGI